MENIIIQFAIAVIGGFVLNLLWDFYEKHIKNKIINRTGHLKRFIEQNKKAHPKLAKCVRYIICFFVIFLLLNVYIEVSRTHYKINKDWINFDWIVCEDKKIGDNFISENHDVFAQMGDNNRELVVWQLPDTILVQVYNTDFDMVKPNVFFSENNRYALVTENKNVNLFNNLDGTLISSFLIQDENVNAVLFIEEEQLIYIVTTVNKSDRRICKYDIAKEKITDERLWEDTIFIGQTKNLEYYLGLEKNVLFSANLNELQEKPVYGKDALCICRDGMLSSMFDENGKYYFEMNFGYSTRIDVRECGDNSIAYNTNVYDLKQWFFDEQDNLYIVHQGFVDKINLLAGDKKVIVDLSKIAENKGENRVGEDYVFVNCSLIKNSNYLVGIVYEPPYNYNRIYMFDMNTGEIVAMSNLESLQPTSTFKTF